MTAVLRRLCLFAYVALMSADSRTILVDAIESADFESEWLLLESYNSTKCFRSVQHGLGEVPLKVKVLVKPTRPPYEGWMFEAGSSQQVDDDLPWLYCGVLYTYSATQVLLYAPSKSNDYDDGKSFCIDPSSWTSGSTTTAVYQAEEKVLVKVFAWKSSSFPVPDVDSQWISIVAGEPPCFTEVAHNITIDLSLVHLQIRCGYENEMVYGEGIGAASSAGLFRNYSTMSGVVFAYNSTHTRIWVPNANYRLVLGTGDGYTYSVNCRGGEFRVRGWKTLGQRPQEFSFTLNGLNDSIPDMSALKVNMKSWNPLTNYISVQVKALDGPNEGFVFPAVGQVQRNAYPGTSYGGVVFGYSADSIRMFVPADDTGTIIHIPENWGTAEYLQMSNNVEIIVTMWNTIVNNCSASKFATWASRTPRRSYCTTEKQFECAFRCLSRLDCIGITCLPDEDRCLFMNVNTVNNRTIDGLFAIEEGLILDTFSCQ